MTPRQKSLLGSLGFISVLTLFVGASQVEEGNLSADTYLWIQGFAVLIGLMALGGAVEKIFDKGFDDFKVSTLWWAIILGIVGYFARMYALVDVNSIFRVDPSALPMTIIAASAIQVFSWMKVPFIFVAVLSLFVIIGMLRGRYFDADASDGAKAASAFLVVSNLVCCSVAAIFISQHLNEESRKQKLYRIALATDFVSQFDCAELSSKTVSVLFIGPEQRRVLVAPLLEPSMPVIFAQPTSQFLTPVTVPSEFPVMNCTPSLSLAPWLEKWTKSLN